MTEPWTVAVEGECNKPAVYHLEDVLKGRTLEDRVYRHRCVEAWSMVIPWVGFPLADFIKECEPTSRARFVEFTSLSDPKQMPGTRVLVLPWPYVEGLRMDEAMHPLTILVVGLYGEVLPNQNGAQGPFDWRAASHRPEMGRPIWRIPLACLDFEGHPRASV